MLGIYRYSLYFKLRYILYFQTSFTIRDDHQKKINMIITKPHNPIYIFKSLYSLEVLLHKIWYIRCMKKPNIKYCAYIGLADSKDTASQYIFLNNKLVHCPLILKIISTTFINTLKFFERQHYEHIPKNEAVFILLFLVCNNYTFTIENKKRTLIFSNIQDLMECIRSKILHIFTKGIKPLCEEEFRKGNETRLTAEDLVTPVSQTDNLNKNSIQLTLSEWSNWSYSKDWKQLENDSLKFYKHFDFLPEKLHKLLRGNTKLIKTDILNEYNGSVYSIKLKSGLQSKHL